MKITVMPAPDAAVIHETLVAEYEVRKQATADGAQNLPDREATEAAPAEQKIIAEIRQAWLRAAEIAGRRRHAAEQQLAAAKAGIEAFLLSVDAEHALNDVRDLFSESEVDRHYREYYRELKERERSQRAFRSANALERSAHYPESRLLGVSIIVLVCFVEAVLNSWLFAKGSEFGLLGGIFQALMISLVNAGALAFLFGYLFLPETNHVDPRRRSRGYLLAATLLFAAVLFNLAVGHYRGEMIAGSLQPARDALESFIARPADLGDMEAWLLFFVGLGAFALSSYKFHTLEDPYPGYGHLDRRLQAATRTMNAAFERLREAARARLESDIAGLDRSFNDLRGLLEQYGRALLERRETAGALKQDAASLHLALVTLLQEYRDFNAKARGGDLPRYWNEPIPLSDFAESAARMEAEEHTRCEAAAAELARLREKVNDERNNLSQVRGRLRSDGAEVIAEGLKRMRERLEARFLADSQPQAGEATKVAEVVEAAR